MNIIIIYMEAESGIEPLSTALQAVDMGLWCH